MSRFGLTMLVVLALLSGPAMVCAQQALDAPSTQPLAPQPLASQSPTTAPQQTLEPASDGAADSSVRSQRAAPVISRELSPWSMFLSADILVKAVMVGLTLASLTTWTVFIAKIIEFFLLRRRLRGALARITDARSLADAQFALGAKDSVLAFLLDAAMREARLSAGISSDGGIRERAASSCAEIVRAEMRRVRTGMGLLATIGAISPFVGLFGTVWGIMNSFIGISKSQTTNLAVVAPGIAEALLATAFGLAAAIPAVIIYNHFARVSKGYLELVNRSSGAAARLLSRDLDRSHGAAVARVAE